MKHAISAGWYTNPNHAWSHLLHSFLELVWRSCSLTKVTILVLIKGGFRYSEEVHWSIKKISAQAYLRQRLVWWTRWENKTKIICLQLKFSKVKFLVRGLEVAQETGPLENSPSKKCCLIDNYVIISFFHAWSSPPEKSWPWCKPQPVKRPFHSQSYCSTPLKFLINALHHRSLNWT